MATEGRRGGAASFLKTLVATVLFPLMWMRAFAFAKRHKDDDPRGKAKVAVAIVLGVVLAGGAVQAVVGFRTSSIDGAYAKMQTRIASDLGEKEYQDQKSIVDSRDTSIPILQGKLADAQAANDTKKVAQLESALANATKERADAAARQAVLAPNHAFYGTIVPFIAAHDDDGLVAAVTSRQAPPYTDVSGNDNDPDGKVREEIRIKDKAVADMDNFLLWFVWPSIAGAFFAPLAFALGSILRKAFVPSDTVGYKPYPAYAAGVFLLLGAFGVPSVPFAAWTFNDMEGRSREGQIAL